MVVAEPDQTYVFSVWVRPRGEPEHWAVYVDFLDADFDVLTDNQPLASATPATPVEGERVRASATAPAGTAWAVPTVFKDSSGGSVLIDEAVFGEAGACQELEGS